MNELKLPEQLKGRWHHVLILTYGADIPFFENALWSQFGARCRNKIILADGDQFLDACANYARGGLVRHLNHRYIADGVFAPRAAHAKLILLTNPERGRLLVGSGNLGWQGYASGGELFTQYEYSTEEPEALNAFLSIRELVDGLFECQYVSNLTAQRIRRLWEEAPWLFQSPEDDEWPVRHNLTHSFIEQLEDAIAGETVEELWILSPFYDEAARALEQVLLRFKPRYIYLLMQPEYTSVDPVALQRVLDSSYSRFKVCSCARGSDNPYLHAKMYLFKLANRAICLQGSPNLSQVAMLLSDPRGNIELANLLTGPVDVFDGLLDSLEIEVDGVSLDALDLSYHPIKTRPEGEGYGWRLTGGEWHDDLLVINYQGPLPDLEGAFLEISGRTFPLTVRERNFRSLELKLSPEAASLLEQPVPVAIRWGEEDITVSNPIFLCNRTALDAALEIEDEGDTLERIGDLDLDDEEFERLLGELEASLVFDRRSVWQMAGRELPSAAEEDDDALRIDYVDVDYEMLRQHPKIQQYRRRGAGRQTYGRSRLQIILSSITDHFRGLLNTDIGQVETILEKLDEGEGETEEEREHEEEERKRRRRTWSQRINRILKNFIRRYLRGISSPHFQELAGFEVMAQNYIIFTHILWRLFFKEWVEPEFLVDALLQTWTFFWGIEHQDGYFWELSEEERNQVLQWIDEYHSDAQFLAALYYSAQLTRFENWNEKRFGLRDFWRGMLRSPPFVVNEGVLEETWHYVAGPITYQPLSPSAIVQELIDLAHFNTRNNFLREIETRYDFPAWSCSFRRQDVFREALDREDTVDCLEVDTAEALSNKAAAVEILRQWMVFEDLGYYRLYVRPNGRLLYYDEREEKGLYWAKDQDRDPEEITSISPETADWEAALSPLSERASRLDAKLTLMQDNVFTDIA